MTVMNQIHITRDDHIRLVNLINGKASLDEHDESLLAELDRAVIIESQDDARDIITMNASTVCSDTDTRETTTYRLVFPEDADIGRRHISVLSPIGCALLGLKTGDIFTVQAPKGVKTLRVDRIMHEPESQDAYET